MEKDVFIVYQGKADSTGKYHTDVLYQGRIHVSGRSKKNQKEATEDAISRIIRYLKKRKYGKRI